MGLAAPVFLFLGSLENTVWARGGMIKLDRRAVPDGKALEGISL
jgi:hypothetical protein